MKSKHKEPEPETPKFDAQTGRPTEPEPKDAGAPPAKPEGEKPFTSELGDYSSDHGKAA